ncbi:hypothetical protein ACLOJK_023951 [Asimina triloba]
MFSCTRVLLTYRGPLRIPTAILYGSCLPDRIPVHSDRSPVLPNSLPLVYRVPFKILTTDPMGILSSRQPSCTESFAISVSDRSAVASSGALFYMNRSAVARNRSPVRRGQERCLWSGALFTGTGFLFFKTGTLST